MARKPTLADHLHAARVRRGLTVAELAETVGVSTASIYQWEAGRHPPRDENLTLLCKALRLPIRATRELVV